MSSMGMICVAAVGANGVHHGSCNSPKGENNCFNFFSFLDADAQGTRLQEIYRKLR